MSNSETDNISVASDISDQEDPYSNIDIQDYNLVKVFLDQINTTVDNATDIEMESVIDSRDNYIDTQDDLVIEFIINDNIIYSDFRNAINTLYE